LPVSFTEGLHRCLGRPELYLKVVRRFLQTHPAELSRFRQAAALDELAVLQQLAHRMVSTASLLGAQALAATARALQQAAEQADRAQCRLLAERFAEQQAGLAQALQRYLAESEQGEVVGR
jgi:HPt (histidine-containing phosphotransfer) domain-containing protein